MNIKAWIQKMNEYGIPLPMVRDPKTQKASVSLTLVFLSSFYVQVSIVNKFAKWFDGVSADSSLEFFIACASLYFGRNLSKKFQSDNKELDKE